MGFELASTYLPRGDQRTAIDQLVRGLENTERHQVLLGVTGSASDPMYWAAQTQFYNQLLWRADLTEY